MPFFSAPACPTGVFRLLRFLLCLHRGVSPYFGLYLQSLALSAWDIGLLMSQMRLMRLFGPYGMGYAGAARPDRRADRAALRPSPA